MSRKVPRMMMVRTAIENHVVDATLFIGAPCFDGLLLYHERRAGRLEILI
jgi:hypothetical protein